MRQLQVKLPVAVLYCTFMTFFQIHCGEQMQISKNVSPQMFMNQCL